MLAGTTTLVSLASAIELVVIIYRYFIDAWTRCLCLAKENLYEFSI
jgi:hypothetical protein